MHKFIILATVVLLAGTTGAIAEDNAELIQPVAYGAVTGDVEKDTVAYDIKQPSDLQVRFTTPCAAGGSQPAKQAALDDASRTNPHAGMVSLAD